MRSTRLERKTPLLRVSKFLRGGALPAGDLACPKPVTFSKEARQLRAKNPMRRRAPRRIAREAVFKPYVEWLHRRACVTCGTHTNIQGSHVGNGGTGQKRGGAEDQVPMCGPRAGGVVEGCHAEWGGYYGRFAKKTRAWRMVAAFGWRVDCWRDFLTWARRELDGVDLAADDEAAKLAACEDEIRAALARLAPAGGAS